VTTRLLVVLLLSFCFHMQLCNFVTFVMKFGLGWWSRTMVNKVFLFLAEQIAN